MAINLISQVLFILLALCRLRVSAIPVEVVDLDASPSELEDEMQAVEQAMAAYLANNGTEGEETTDQEPLKPKRTIGSQLGYGYPSANSLAQDAPQHRYPSAAGYNGLPTHQATPVRYYYTKSVDPLAYASANPAGISTATVPTHSLLPPYFAAPQSIAAPLLPSALPVIVVKVNEQGQVLGMHQAAMAINVQQMVMNYLQQVLASSPTLLQPASVQPVEAITKKVQASQQQHQQPTPQQQTVYYGQYKTIRKLNDSQNPASGSPEYSINFSKSK